MHNQEKIHLSPTRRTSRREVWPARGATSGQVSGKGSIVGIICARIIVSPLVIMHEDLRNVLAFLLAVLNIMSLY